MSIRVHELAKELEITSKVLLEKLKSWKVEVKGHMSVLDPDIVERLQNDYRLTAKKAALKKSAEKKLAGNKKVEEKKPEEKKPEEKKTEGKKVEAKKTQEKEKTDEKKPEIKKPEAVKPEEKKPEEKKPEEKKLEEKKPEISLKKAPEKKIFEKKVFVKPPVEIKPSEPKPAMVFSSEQRTEKNLPKEIRLNFPITVKDLAVKLQINAPELIKKLMQLRIMATINFALDEATVKQVCQTLGVNVEKELTDEEVLLSRHMVKKSSAGNKSRSPVVTFMGHVDHGKTSLLDAIRKTKVAQKESGGITQHIGAYSVECVKGRITFLDTPGHEAFTAMRSRGANITDIVVIVVAADDSVMPQTVEAINHAKAANVPIIIAINKIDLPGASPDKVKAKLAEFDLTSEDWGGKTIMAMVSAKTGEGIEHLLEMILLEAEMCELRSDPEMLAKGVIIESKLSKGSGPTATVLVQDGTLRVGDVFVCGLTYGKVRAMIDDSGKRISAAGPSSPAEISGLSQVPQVGDYFYVVEDEKKAKEITLKKNVDTREQNLMPSQRMSLDQLYQQAQQGQVKELKIILKTDVQGSLEALAASLQELGTKDISVKIIHSQVGTINESDVMLAEASDAVILGFHVSVDARAREEAEKKNIDIRLYRIIYEAINDVKLSMEGMLEPTLRETFVGRAKVLQMFKVSTAGKIAGCSVVKGKMVRTAELVKVFRKERLVYEGKIESLKRYKDDAKEVSEGMECGIALDKFSSMEPDDIIECYRIEKIARKL